MRGRTRVLAAGVVGMALAGVPDLAAQELSAFSTPRGVEVRIIDQSYGIQGGTAQELLDQLRGVSLVSFPYEYGWRYRTRQLASVAGRPTLHCGVDDITIAFTVRATYPRWENRPGDVSAELLEAWGIFEEQLESFWREQQDAMVSFARDARREVLRIEEGCPIIQQIVNDRVQRAHDRSAEREREAAAEGERTSLRWPPEGYEGLMAISAGARATDGESPPNASADVTTPRRPPPLPPEGRNAPTGGAVGIERVLVSDVGPGAMLGAVAGLRAAGEVDYLGAAGFADFGEGEPLHVTAPARLSGFTEVVVAAVAVGLAEEGAVDLQDPISGLLPDLEPRLGATTLHSLLAHRSGIDDARPSDSDWSKILDELDDRAVFTRPGVVRSYSRYDYPLAVRVLERATGASMETLAVRFVFGPAGMTGSRMEPSDRGLPTTLVTASDLLAFGAAVAGGVVAVAPAEDREALWGAAAGRGGSYFGGLRWDTPADVRRMTLMCEAGTGTDAVALQIYPDDDVVQVLWSRPRSSGQVWPATVARLMLEDLGAKLGLGPSVFEPRRLRGVADLETDPTLCEEPDWNPRQIARAGEPLEPGRWVGRYLNGDRRVTLEDRGGVLALTDEMELTVAHHEGDVHFATMNGMPLYPLRLVRDDVGRRYVLLHGRAYIHDDDRER